MKISLKTLMIAVTLSAIYFAAQKAHDDYKFHAGDGPNAKRLAADLAAFNEAAPESDVVASLMNGDKRFIGFRGKQGLVFPGQPNSQWQEIIDSKEFREFQGTSGELESRNHNWLTARARQYAERYNACLVELRRKHASSQTAN